MTRSARKGTATKRPVTDEITIEVDGDQVIGFISQDDDGDMSPTTRSPTSQSDRGVQPAEASSPLSSTVRSHGPTPEDDIDASGEEEAEPPSHSSQLVASPAINETLDFQPHLGLKLPEAVENERAERLDSFPGKPWRDQVQRLLGLLDEAQIGFTRDQQPPRKGTSIFDVCNVHK